MAGRPKRPDDRVTLDVKLPPELHARLVRVADERMVGRNLLVTRAIEEFLDRLVPIERLTRDG